MRFGEMPENKIEQKEFPSGEYRVVVKFKERTSEGSKETEMEIDPFVLDDWDEKSKESVIEKAIGRACRLGLHNFGLDTNRAQYPNGQPVEFLVRHDSGKEVSFEKNFDGRGWPVDIK